MICCHANNSWLVPNCQKFIPSVTAQLESLVSVDCGFLQIEEKLSCYHATRVHNIKREPFFLYYELLLSKTSVTKICNFKINRDHNNKK